MGAGRTAVCWYRIAVPAMYLGCDWAGVDDEMQYMGGIARGATAPPRLEDYKIIVWQQPRSEFAKAAMKDLQRNGAKILIDVDDYLHGVRRMKDHDFKDSKIFSKKELAKFERTMAQADGIICSTEWLRKKYSQFNENTWVCLNGLDMGRYDKSRSQFKGVNIGWAGATGHINAFQPVLDAVKRIMHDYPFVNFVSVGQPFADVLHEHGIARDRVFSVPFSSLEVYPNAMALFSITLAPARDSGWYRAKSALRYYEAAAVGVPTVGEGWLYPEIEHGRTGFKVETPDEWYKYLEILVTDHKKRFEMGVLARQAALTQFDMHVRAKQWELVLDDVAKTIE